jgi:D-arabinose 1-dehydrogenase-like Zn-dependent alcohol dehydrogenase
MGFRVVAIGRGQDKRSMTAAVGANRYIDSLTEDPAAALQKMGGAKAILATASSKKLWGRWLAGLDRGVN